MCPPTAASCRALRRPLRPPALAGASAKPIARRLLIIQRDLARALGEVNDLGKALQHVLKAALGVEGIDCGGIYLVDRATRGVNLAAHARLSRSFVRKVSHYSASTREMHLLMAGKPIYRSVSYVLRRSLLRQEKLRSLAVIPIRLASDAVASLNFGSRTQADIPAAARAALESIAAQASGALRRIAVLSEIEESQRNLDSIFNSIEDLVFVVDEDGCILDVNAAVVNRLGYARKALLGRKLVSVHPPRLRRQAGEILRSILAGKFANCHIPLQTRNGKLIPVETRVTLGRWREKPAIFGVSRDISDRLAAEQALHENESRLRSILDATKDVAFLMRCDGTALAVNDKTLGEFSARHSSDVVGRSVYNFLPRALAVQRRRNVQEAIRTCKPITFVDKWNDRWLDQRVFPILNAHGEVSELAVFQRDITAQRRLEQEIVRVSEHEKHRIGQVLHDTLVQHLAGTKFLVQALERRLKESGSPEAAEAARIGDLARDALMQARSVARGLSPLSAFTGGLEPAIRLLAQDTREMFGVTCHVMLRLSTPVAAEPMASHLYYIIREAVSNAVRHSHPTRIWIRLVSTGRQGSIKVTDDGSGIRRSSQNGGLGLNIMRYRAEAMGGTLRLARRRPQGTSVVCRFPL